MSDYFFGLGKGWLDKRAERIAEKHGARLVNYIDPQCTCGHGCKLYSCKASRRHWFAAHNYGSPLDQQTADAVLSELERRKQ